MQTQVSGPIGQRSPQVIGSIPARGQNCLDSSEYQAIVISQFLKKKEQNLCQWSRSTIIHFLEQRLITKYGVPSMLVFNNVTYVSSLKLILFYLHKGIIMWYSYKYYLQGNGVDESLNKNLISILKKIVVDNQWN